MCTTNGVGLGHLTRTMAVARRLPDDLVPVVFTLSQAAPLVRAAGFPVEFLFSAGYLGTDRGDWQLLYERRLDELIDAYDPAIVTFDGTHPYVGLLRAARRHPTRAFVWLRRAMWKPGVGRGVVRRSALFDLVVEPGEVAEEADRGATVGDRARARRVRPVVLHDDDELLPTAEARAELGLDQSGRWALVQLGAGAINDVASPAAQAFAELSRIDGLRIAFAESPISPSRATLPDGVTGLRRYPLLPCLRAFDLVVTAAGYNSYHESVAAGVPALFVPNTRTQADDQLARARWAAEAGFGACWVEDGRVSFGEAFAPLRDEEGRAAMRSAAAAAWPGNGAREAADALARLVTVAA